MRLLRGEDALRVRWRNDGGWTREITREPSTGESFDWRVSIAEVEVDGPFSAFDGCDRVLVLLEGAGMDLANAATGATTELRPDSRRSRFAGEVPIVATLLAGPTTDFNLIWRRDSSVATARYVEGRHEIGAGGGAEVVAGAYLAHGSATLIDGTVAAAGDTFVSDPGERVHLDLDGSMVAFVVASLAAAERGLTGLTVVEKDRD